MISASLHHYQNEDEQPIVVIAMFAFSLLLARSCDDPSAYITSLLTLFLVLPYGWCKGRVLELLHALLPRLYRQAVRLSPLPMAHLP